MNQTNEKLMELLSRSNKEEIDEMMNFLKEVKKVKKIPLISKGHFTRKRRAQS